MIMSSAWRFCFPLAFLLGLAACATTPPAASPEPVSIMDEARNLYLAHEYERALPLMRQQAELGNPQAQYTLGYMYYHGEGVPEDMDEALKWIRRAAAQGDVHALEALSSLASAGLRPQEKTISPEDEPD